MGLFGGQKTTIPATGYYALPGDLKDQYQSFWQAIPGATAADNFKMPDYNQDQQSAFSMVRGAANPTSSSISQLLSSYMNPYNDYVIQGINREAQGQNSILKNAMTQAGQLGSNRGLLGANDIDLTRQNQIGGFLQSQFNNALQTGLGQQQQGIQNLLGIGNQQQQQQFQNQQAPLQGLQAQQGLLQPTVDYVGKSSPEQTIKTGGGIGGLLSGLGSIASLATGNPLFALGGNALGGATGGGSMFGSGWSPTQGVGWAGNMFMGA